MAGSVRCISAGGDDREIRRMVSAWEIRTRREEQIPASGGEQGPRHRVLRRDQQPASGALLHHPALVKNQDPVGDAQDHGQVVGDEDHGHSPLHLQVLEQLEQLGLLAGVEHGDGIVGHQQLGCQDQCPSQRHPLQLPAGQLMGVPAEEGVVTGEPARLDGGADQLYVAWLPSFGDWSTNKRFCRSGAPRHWRDLASPGSSAIATARAWQCRTRRR